MTTMPERTATLSALVAAEVRAQMGRLGVRQNELARRMGENDQWVSSRLKGRTPIDLNDLYRFAKALGIGVYDLLPGPDEAAGAADPRAIAHYFAVPDRTTDHAARTARPRDNRPPGRPAAAGTGRTGYLPRGKGPERR